MWVRLLFGLCSLLFLGSRTMAGGGHQPRFGLPRFSTSPAETLYFDDGFPESYQGLSDLMCEYLPTPNSTSYPLDIVTVLWNSYDTTPFELRIWDDDGSGGMPGTVLHSQAVNPPTAGWFEIQISPPVTISSGRVHVGCATYVGIGYDETNPDYDSAYVNLGPWWDPVWWYGPHGDFLIRAIIEPTPPQNDVGVIQITAPDTLINPNQPLDPEAVVENFGVLDQDSFEVWCLIDSISTNIYTEVDTVFALASGDTCLVTFPSWTPNGGGNAYNVTVCTSLPGDEVPDNDTLTKTVYTILHDGGVDTILSPPDTVHPDSAYSPKARVHNHGNVPETFDVQCTITPAGYVDTFHVTALEPDSSAVCTFAFWQPVSGEYTVTVVTLVEFDADPSNDSLSKTIYTFVGVKEVSDFQSTTSSSKLLHNYPNPFTRTTTIHYSVPPRRGDTGTRSGGDSSTYQRINLSVYDLSGSLVRVLVDESVPTSYSLLPTSMVWDGRDARGEMVLSGLYFCRLRVQGTDGNEGWDRIATAKILVLR